ncbi:PAS domain S-box-containing protein/diguanylate cyclase (GGDEF)-like protein [Alteromonas sp. I10]|uniref:EAL domain-containing protein n=1 Tax=Alteromonas TaxID=226 RepID=UPI000D75FB34|nr:MULTISPECIES: EAL domain-containing protein [Alteromonas]PXW76842.1 PAS domain S-box-containing protein/diguanylate cyclase (GGDEF)-like protein [Alteromonas sp. I10]
MRSTLIYSISLLLLALSGILFSSAKAIEVSDLHFTELNKQHGLSDTAVLDIVEDDMGFIWLATSNGLNRYSGYDVIKKYHPSDIDPNSIPAGFIQTLFLDSEGILWVGTHSGLAKYQPKTDNFKVYGRFNSVIKTDHITSISEDREGNILFADRKFLYKYSKQDDVITVVAQLFENESVIKVIFAETNRIWVGSNEYGGKILDLDTEEVFDLKKVNPWGIVLDSNAIHDIKVINGNYWLATDDGVKVLSASGRTLLHIDGSILEQNKKVNTLSLEVVNKNLWLGTVSGLFILKDIVDTDISDSKKLKVLHLNSDTYEATGLPSAIVIKVLQDKAGVVWSGTFRQGAFRYHPEYADVHFQPVYNSERKHQDNYSTIWGFGENSKEDIFLVSQQRGLGKYNEESGEVKFYLPPSEQVQNLSYWDLKIDTNDYFWLATSDGLKIYRLINGNLELVKTFFDGKFVDHIHMDKQFVWIWLENDGTYAIDFSILNHPDGKNIVTKLDGEEINERMLPVYTDDKGRLWLRDDKSLVIYSLQNEAIVKRLDAASGINSIVYGVYQTPDAFWLTSRSDGVIRVNKKTLSVEKKQPRNDKNGYITSTIGIQNSIWYSDTTGIHQIHLPSLKEESTILNSELEYNSLGESAILASSDGSIYFGGIKGFNRVTKSYSNSELSIVSTNIPVLSEFSVFGDASNNDPLNTNNLSYLSENITYANAKKLSYDESRFSISFGLVNPVYPKLVSYRYRLMGYENNWVYLGADNTAKFNNVSFGNYEFEVQAKEPGKNWSSSRHLKINIDNPPWLHTVALVFYCIIALATFSFIVRQYQIRKANQLAIKESEERLKLTLWSSGDELWDWDVYRGQVYRANTWGTLDFPQDDIRTTGAYDANIHPNDVSRVKTALREHLEGNSDFYELAYRAKTFKNQWIWILDRGKVVERDHNDQPVRMTGTLKNIHHLKEAEEQLNLFKRSIENISEGVFITNTQFKFISVNNAYCGYTGETRDQALASYMHFHLYPDAFTEEIKKTLKAKGNWSGEVESVRVNGERYEMELNIDAVHDDDGKISHFVGVFSDITSRKSTEKELLKLANTDPLTELPNRSFFQASHQNLVRKGAQHTLLCLDMDNFKKINDSLGHQTGDILIKQIAKRLQRITGKSATCYRLGGDEFSVLMEDNADIHTVTHYAQNLLDTLSRPFIINKQEFVLGASIGIAFFPDDGTSPQEMLKNADTAMYFAKNNGGNSYQFFSGEMNQNAVRQLQIENLIRQGIKDDLFTVYYQPKVDIASGKLVSMEALVRFEHPQKGIVSPGQFIPLAEQTGQIIEIGEQVLRKACADTKRWVNQGLFSGRVAVNISAKQFELPDLDDRINKILSDIGLSPLHLECEITEGTLMESPENGLQMMTRLRERGIHLALDDFGTGYSSLAYLKRFPLNTLKIDKAFIDDIAKSNVDRHMAAAIINIAHNLGLKVVAEGVEEEAQLDILRRYDCEMLQGFLYSRPLNAERFEKLLTENQKLHTLLGHSNF